MVFFLNPMVLIYFRYSPATSVINQQLSILFYEIRVLKNNARVKIDKFEKNQHLF